MKLAFVALDEFGDLVYRRLVSLPLCIDVTKARCLEPGGDAAYVVFAAQAGQSAMSNYLDSLVWCGMSAFIPMTASPEVLEWGPVVVPGKSACWHCFDMRKQQHASRQSEDVAQGMSRPRPPRHSLGIFAQIAAAQILKTLSTQDGLYRQAGCAWSLSASGSRIVHSCTVGIHACPRCGLKRDTASLSTAGLLQYYYSSGALLAKSELPE